MPALTDITLFDSSITVFLTERPSVINILANANRLCAKDVILNEFQVGKWNPMTFIAF